MTLKRKLLTVLVGLAVVPVSLVGALVAVGAVRYAIDGQKERLRKSIDALALGIDQESAARQSVLHCYLVTQMEMNGHPACSDFPSWFAHSAGIRSAFTQRPRLTSRVVVACAGRDSAYAVRWAGYDVSGAWVPLSTVPYLGPALRNSELSPAGPPGDWLRTPHASGPVVAVGTFLPATGTLPSLLVLQEVSTVFLFRWLLEEKAAVPALAALSPTDDPGRWRMLYATDLTLIGRSIATANLPNRAEAAVIRSARDARRPGPSAGGSDGCRFEVSHGMLHGARVYRPTGWILGGSVPLAPALTPILIVVGIAALQVLVTCLLVVLGIVYVTRGVGDAVGEIAAGTEAISQGDLTRTIRINRSDEFGTIAQHVNQMAHDLILAGEASAIARLRSRIMHELKGVASQMTLLLYNLKQHRDDPEFQAEFFPLLEGLSDRIKKLTLQLRQGGAQDPPRLREVRLDLLLGDLVRTRISPAWPDLRVEIQIPKGLMTVTDPAMLSEAAGNILVNAAEAMKGKGALRLRAGAMEAPRPGCATAPTAFLEITDTGPGMSPEFARGELFRPFATTKAGGLGLGMYAAREALRRLGGRVEVVSAPGEGTTVRMELGQRCEVAGANQPT